MRNLRKKNSPIVKKLRNARNFSELDDAISEGAPGGT